MRKYGRSIPSGRWRGNCTASWSGQGSALGPGLESSPATVSRMRCSNLSHAVSGLSVRSSQLTRSASVLPSCRACTHTPATAGANQRDLWMTWPSRGNHERATRVQAESSGETGTVPGICGAWTTSRTSGGAAGESERTYCASRHSSSSVRNFWSIRSANDGIGVRSEEHTSELHSRPHLVCRLLLAQKKSGGHHILIPPHGSSRPDTLVHFTIQRALWVLTREQSQMLHGTELPRCLH